MMSATKREIWKRGKKRWEVDFGQDDNGKRLRPLFRTEADADGAIEKHEKAAKAHGDYLARLAATERAMIVAVHQEIMAAGKTLSGVWGEYQTWKKEVATHNAITPMAYQKVVEEFKNRKLKAGKTHRYVNNTGEFLMRFGSGREQQPIHEISPTDLETWIEAQVKQETWSLSTKKTYMTLFSSLWTVAVAKGWASSNIVNRLEKVGKITVKVEIYANETTRNIMAAAMSTPATQQIIAPLALGFFGCMRPEEIESAKAKSEGMPESEYFNWDDIDLKNGLCKVRNTKTGDERTIRLQRTAVKWLKLAKKLGNPLPPVNERRLVDQCCEIIGLENWIRDGARKNCATHLRPVYKNDYDVIKDCGNSIRVLLKHYAALHVPESQSMEHWEIDPDSVTKFLKSKEWEKITRDASRLKTNSAADKD
ncbi:MAG: hypothetical protein QM813_03380 [Verrucomicrobiota bacterium]